MKEDTKTDEVERPEHVFQLSEKEKKDKFFRLRYSAREDRYSRYDSDGTAIDGWQNGTHTMVNLRRYKTELNGEEMVYLTRKSECASASVSWKFDFRDSDLVIDNIQAITYSRTENDGSITYDMATEDHNKDKTGNKGDSVLNGWQTLLFIAYIDGSPNSYEPSQTQFLYQNVTREPEFCPLDIMITLKPLEKIRCTCNLKKEINTDKTNGTDKYKITPNEDNIEPVCTCDKCTCKKYNAMRKVSLVDGTKRGKKAAKSKDSKKKTKKPPDKDTKLKGKHDDCGEITQEKGAKPKGKHGDYGETTPEKGAKLKRKNGDCGEITLKVPINARVSVSDFTSKDKSPSGSAVSVGSLSSGGASFVTYMPGAVPHNSTPRGSNTSVKPSTSKDTTTSKYRRCSSSLSIISRSTSQGNVREAWGESKLERQIGQSEPGDEADTVPLTPSKKDKKCTIL